MEPKNETDEDYQKRMDELCDMIVELCNENCANPLEVALLCAHIAGSAISQIQLFSDRRRAMKDVLGLLGRGAGADITVTAEKLMGSKGD